MKIDTLDRGTMAIVDTKDIMASFKNPRKIGQRALEELMANIQRDPHYLLKRPILCNKVNGKYVVYAGTQRFVALKELGLKRVPIRYSENINKETVDHRMLLDNVNRGQFDEEKLMKDFAGELEMLSRAEDFKDIKFALDSKPEKKRMLHLKLVFQMREHLTLFYTLLEDLQERYPDETVSRRLFLFLSNLEDK